MATGPITRTAVPTKAVSMRKTMKAAIFGLSAVPMEQPRYIVKLVRHD
jgi:hypothetical protein